MKVRIDFIVNVDAAAWAKREALDPKDQGAIRADVKDTVQWVAEAWIKDRHAAGDPQ